jgi:hypothetical protein
MGWATRNCRWAGPAEGRLAVPAGGGGWRGADGLGQVGGGLAGPAGRVEGF